MARTQLSVPVSLIIVVAGSAFTFAVLHANGWGPTGPVPMAEVYRKLSTLSRGLVVAGFVATAWGTGSLIHAVVGKKTT